MTTTLDNPRALLDLIGSELGHTDWREITQEQVNRFADATGDHQWIHTDPVRAVEGPFGTAIAHGYLTLALTPIALAEVLTIEQLGATLNYGANKVRFPAPVPVAAKLRATVTLTAAVEKPAGIEAVFTLTYEIQGGTRPVCVAEVVVVYR
ncbi:MaoC family dehydratase [Rhodococcus chondri]|uniref:MaoC family dehydratase n=1 Tax=Rhodococcus chondri TaxID=3065941 RepID=A0ABU7JQS9_9NOCA|nr:MaoC family dehydratase [Rhodococcus sp. CC-R104]MEE2032244.1 MaoC family dehydratase [Rhodococcus sp. CC-R104]